jgi:small conductance mechanosensitive channel
VESKTYIDRIIDFAWNYGPNLIISLALLLGGLWLIRRMSAAFQQFLKARHVDESLRPFFASLVDVGMKVALLIVVAGRMGFETTSFIAVFSALAFAIGLALQGSLGNFASGVLILLFRPYKVGDMITVGDKTGTVQEIQIFNTVLLTPTGKKVILPNGKVTEGPIENVTIDGVVRADIEVHVKDFTPIPLLRQAAVAAILQCPNRQEDSAPFVEIAGFPHDSMKILVGCWTTGRYYWDTFYFLHEAFKNEMDKSGIQLAQADYEQA